MKIKSFCFTLMIVCGVLTLSLNAQVAPKNRVIVGTIISMNGNDVTVASAHSPKLTRTFKLGRDTKFVHNKETVSRTALTVGSSITVNQVQDAQGQYNTERVDILNKK